MKKVLILCFVLCVLDLTLVAQTGHATTYVRWGRTECNGDAEKVYTGYSGGSHYSHSGGAANWLCLSSDPEWGYYEDTVQSGAKVYGGEYEFGDLHYGGGLNYFGRNLNDHDAPCFVCLPPRPSIVMVPGRKTCYTGWTLEYSGYLVSGYYHHASASEFICLDSNAKGSSRGYANNNGKTFYLAEGYCGSLPCPPYVQGRELTCVVCSK